MATIIKVGRTVVNFNLRKDENVFQDEHSGGWVAEFKSFMRDGKWYRLGVYGIREAACKVLYVERDQVPRMV